MECQPRLNKKYKPALYCISSFFKGTSVESYMIQLPVILLLVLHHFLYQQISFFCNFLELHSTLSKKDFCHKFCFFNRFTQTSYPLNGQNLQNEINFFCQFSLKCLLKYLCQKFIQKILQKYLLCISSELQIRFKMQIIYKVQNADYLVFFFEHFKNNYFDTSTSDYLKIEFLEFFLY